MSSWQPGEATSLRQRRAASATKPRTSEVQAEVAIETNGINEERVKRMNCGHRRLKPALPNNTRLLHCLIFEAQYAEAYEGAYRTGRIP